MYVHHALLRYGALVRSAYRYPDQPKGRCGVCAPSPVNLVGDSISAVFTGGNSVVSAWRVGIGRCRPRVAGPVDSWLAGYKGGA